MKKILFANIGWMKYYQGNTDTDFIKGGGSWDDADKHEIYNFQEVDGWYHGYAQPAGMTINLNAIDEMCEGDVLKDVLVVWVAPFFGKKARCIVGWYKHATVYRYRQKEKKGVRGDYDFNIKAKKGDCTLLPEMERTFEVPRSRYKGEGFTGRPTIWYADSTNPDVVKYREKVWKYINNYSSKSPSTSHKPAKKVDVVAREKVEKAAVAYVDHYYSELGFKVESVEKENKGWDLEARIGESELLLEVKGLANNEISVHITRNEFNQMKLNKDIYHLCVVTNALTSPTLYTFEWDDDKEYCISNDGNGLILKIDLIPSYVAFVE